MIDTRIERAKTLLKIEASAVSRCADLLGPAFSKAVDQIDATLNAGKKLVFLGVGKSHYVAAKLAASFTSAGMTSVFVHPAEAFHGDLGAVSPGDCCVCLSKSGSTSEIVALLPFLKGRNPLIAIVGEPNSMLGKNVDIVLDASVEREACPINLLPTASTTVALALGDALMSVCAEKRGFTKQEFAGYHPGGSLGRRLTLKVSDVMKKINEVATGSEMTPLLQVAQLMSVCAEIRGFTKQEFAGYHPGGSLGRRLTLKVSDVMKKINEVATGSEMTPLLQIAQLMSEKPLGAFCILGSHNELLGIVTEGDVRRAVAQSKDLKIPAKALMHVDPITLHPNMILDEALTFLESKRKVNTAPVVENGKLIGLVQLHDLV